MTPTPDSVAVIERLAAKIEQLAFSMPPPNQWTPQFVSLAQAIRLSTMTIAPSAPHWGNVPELDEDSAPAAEELDTGNLVDDPLYKAFDALYSKGWADGESHKFDPRGSNEWQAVLDLFRVAAKPATPPHAGQAEQLPPLPDPELMTLLGENGWTATQMIDYARAALATRAEAPRGEAVVRSVAWYARHDEECAVRHDHMHQAKPRCTCGLQEALDREQSAPPLAGQRENAVPLAQMYVSDRLVELCPIRTPDLPNNMIRELLGNGTHNLYARPASDGAVDEWTDEQCVEFMRVALRHVEYKTGTDSPTCNDIRMGVKRALALTSQQQAGGSDGA